MKKRKNAFTKRINANVIVSFLAVVLTIFALLSAFINLNHPLYNGADNIMNLIFSLLCFLLGVGLTLDCFMRKDSTHIVLTSLSLLTLIAYHLTKGFYFMGKISTLSIIFHFVSAVLLAVLVLSFFRKALNGDADLLFKAMAIAAIVIFVFSNVFEYTVFNAYSMKDSPLYWVGYLATRSLSLLLLASLVVSINSDYDPYPLKYDKLGNVIVEKENEEQKDK